MSKKKIIGQIILAIYMIIFISFSVYLHTEYGKVIDMSGCFSRKYLSAIKYADSLNKENLIYSNTAKDGTTEIYIKFQTTVDKQNYLELTDSNKIDECITNLNENEVLLLKNSECNVEILKNNDYKVEEFNEYVVIYK